jgi:hypothetical protein
MAKALGGRKVGLGWMARCPAHDDREPSLSIRDSDGKVLVRCHAGCDQRDVIAALKARGLWDGKERSTLWKSSRRKVSPLRPDPDQVERSAFCAFDMAVHASCRKHACRSLSRFAWPDLSAAAVIALSFGLEASLGRDLALHGGAGEAGR